MESQRKATRCLFSLALTASILLVGLAPSGHFGDQFLVTSQAAAPLPAVLHGGEGWRLVDNGLTNLAVAALAIDPVRPERVYAGTIGGGVFKSTDGGAIWINVGLNARFGTALAINPVSPDVVYAGTADGGFCNALRPLFKSTNGGASWSNQSSMADCDISLLVIDPTSPDTLYAGSETQYSSEGGIFLWKSFDGGATWHVTHGFGGPGLASYGLTINPANPQILYAPGDLYSNGRVVDSGLFTSADGGANWRPTGLTNTHVRAVAIDPFTPGILYAGSLDGSMRGNALPFRGLFKSTDGGASWFAINNGLTNITTIYNIVIDRDNTNVLYVGTNGGVFKSVDGGANWSAFNNGLTNSEVFSLALAPGSPNTLYAGTRVGVFKVTDHTPGPNPIDDLQFFVRQHYLDFLGREPDAAGLEFWSSQITACGADAQCVEVKRVNVSAAFFLSIEFQETGYLVYRMYKAAYGDAGSPGVPGTVPAIRLGEFVPDTRKVAERVEVGIGDWQARLEANKSAFALEFVQRGRFLGAYPATMSPADFVNGLDARAGGVLSPQERDQLVAELTADDPTAGRASVLREIAEDDDLARNEFNRAFVLMQYFGYLRRNPDDLPDSNFGGWQFWLSKLNAFDGNYVEAEMVKAFIQSIEYGDRFGQ